MYQETHTKEVSIASCIVLFLILAFVAFVAYTTLVEKNAPGYGRQITIHIDRLPVHVTLARTEAEKQKGMTDKRNIPWNSGMLFVFDTPDYWRVSMKEMKFPIDIFWIDENGVIVDIADNVAPFSEGGVEPRKKALYILETRADFAAVHNIVVGDTITF